MIRFFLNEQQLYGVIPLNYERITSNDTSDLDTNKMRLSRSLSSAHSVDQDGMGPGQALTCKQWL